MLFTLGCLVLSDGMSNQWRPLFNSLASRGLSWSLALLMVFLVDIGFVAWLIFKTGGGIDCPFQPVLFLLPTLALFLRESSSWVVLYSVLVGLAFVILVVDPRCHDREETERNRLPLLIVTLMCLALGSFIGIFTRNA